MAKLCEDFDDCRDLDATLLINTAFQGPPLALDLTELSFGSYATSAAAARPYIDVSVEQTWTAREACYGPVRSIFSLAPGETVQLQVLAEQRTSLAQTVADHLPDVLPPLVPGFGGIPPFGSPVASSAQQQKAVQAAVIHQEQALARANRQIGAYGSLFWDVVDPAGLHKVFSGDPSPPIPPDPAGLVVGAVAKLVGGTTSGPQSVIKATVNDAAHAAAQAGVAAGRHTRDDTTTHSSDAEQQQTLTRTFANPYRDRSLQLRFIPVFRRFDVTTKPAAAKVGVALHAGVFQSVENVAGQAERGGVRLADVFGSASHPELQRRLGALLSPAPGAGAHRALAWPQAELRDDSLLVPFAPAPAAASALRARGEVRATLISALGPRLDSAISAARAAQQSVHLFLGTHIEAVAGGCVLTDLPPPETEPDPE